MKVRTYLLARAVAALALSACGVGSPTKPTPMPAPIDINAHEGLAGPIAFSPDGSLLASAGDDGRILLWQVSALAEQLGAAAAP